MLQSQPDDEVQATALWEEKYKKRISQLGSSIRRDWECRGDKRLRVRTISGFLSWLQFLQLWKPLSITLLLIMSSYFRFQLFHTCLCSASPGPVEMVIRKALLFELLPLTWTVHPDCVRSDPPAVMLLTWEGESLQLRGGDKQLEWVKRNKLFTQLSCRQNRMCDCNLRHRR